MNKKPAGYGPWGHKKSDTTKHTRMQIPNWRHNNLQKTTQLTPRRSILSVYLPRRYILKAKRVTRNQFSFSTLLANHNASIAIFTEAQLTYNIISFPSAQHSDPIFYRSYHLHLLQNNGCVFPRAVQ